MSPRLARRDFFLQVLNAPVARHRRWAETGGQGAIDMYGHLLRLAATVRDGHPATPAQVAELNHLFEQYSAVRIRVTLEEVPGQTRLEAVLGDSQEEDGRRIYFEALVSLLEVLEEGDLRLANCEACQGWFIPYSRAAVARFCSARCRSRHHYQERRKEALR